MPTDMLSAPVPTVDGWTVERVVRHLGKIHQWVSALLESPTGADSSAIAASMVGIPRGPDCLPAYGEALEKMLAAFAVHDPNQPVATFLGEGTVEFWARRQAHEVSIHRVDASDALHAAGGDIGAALDPLGAADGVEEWLEVFVANKSAPDQNPSIEELRSCSIGVQINDYTTAWLVRFDKQGSVDKVDHLTISDGHSDQLSEADVVLRGDATSMMLTCWRRRSLDTIEISGERAAAEAFIDTMRF